MTKKEALKEFLETIDIGLTNGDKPMRTEAWNNWTYLLCKDGIITLKQYESWTNPF